MRTCLAADALRLDFRRPRESDKESEHTGWESAVSSKGIKQQDSQEDSIAWTLLFTQYSRRLCHPGSLNTLCVHAESLGNLHILF